MDIEALHNYCISKPGATESFPFDDSTLVFKAGNKMFALADLKNGDRVNLKCDPERAVELREQYSEVQPGFHMNKTTWNTVFINGSLSPKLIQEMIDHSYELIVASLPKRLQAEIKLL